MNTKMVKVLGVVALVSMLGFASVAQAGKIVTDDGAATLGYGGWDLNNIDVVIKDENGIVITDGFDTSDGSYDLGYRTFESFINVSAATSTPMGVLHGKDYPVGEPAGIKIINNDPGNINPPKPVNCIITTSYLETGYLDSTSPEETLCSSGFQTHKRFKVNMLPDSLGQSIDLVFKVTSDGETDTLRHYQMFQKINNYTGSRLAGFRLEVGTGVGNAFQKSTETLANISLSSSTDPTTPIWEADEMATFSHGLFGPIDKHFSENGFFDSRAAGYTVTAESGPNISDTIESVVELDSNYNEIPPGSGLTNQFGPWLYGDVAEDVDRGIGEVKGIAPLGIFFDDDGDPDTDAELKAFWGEITTGTYDWMYGNNHDPAFAAVESEVFSIWAADPLYTMDVIEDTLNLGLNYIVSIGIVSPTWPTYEPSAIGGSATFTLRMIPIEYTGGIGDPGYVGNPPGGSDLLQPGDEGTVSVSPSPTFESGHPLTLTIADGNTDEGTISVTVTNLNTLEEENALVFNDISEDRGIYLAELLTSSDPADSALVGTMFVQSGDVLEITYHDDDPDADVTVETTEADSVYYVIPIPDGGAAVFYL